MNRNSPGSPDQAEKRWSDQQVEHFRFYVQVALDHANKRNDRVAQVLCYLSLMRGAGWISAASGAATISAAAFQNYHGTSGTQAAHYLPCQLKIGARLVSDYCPHRSFRLKLDSLFGDVETLPPDFNKADSEAEKDGLCTAFAAASNEIIRSTPPHGAARIDRATVRVAYATVWIPRARTAFEAAIAKKGDKYTAPELQFGVAGTPEYGTILNLEEREEATKYQYGVEQQRRILERYIESLTTTPRTLGDSAMSELEHLLQC